MIWKCSVEWYSVKGVVCYGVVWRGVVEIGRKSVVDQSDHSCAAHVTWPHFKMAATTYVTTLACLALQRDD